MLKRIFIISICIAMLFTVLTACNNEDIPKENENKTEGLKGEIQWFTHRTDFESAGGILSTYVSKFKEKNPDVEIKFKTEKDYENSLKLVMSSGDVPDVFGLAGNQLTWDQLKAYVKPVNDVEYYGNFITESLAPFTDEEKNTYGFPTGLSATAIVYNKKLFNEVGVEVPKTLDELVEVSKKIRDSKEGRVGMAIAAKAKWTCGFYWWGLATVKNGDVEAINKMTEVDEPFKKGEPVVTGLEIVDLFTKEGIFEKDPNGSDWEPMKTRFRSGDVGMYFLGNWFIPQAIEESNLTEADIGFFPFPYDNEDGPKNVPVGPDYGWGMAKESQNPELQKAFFDFLCDEMYADWAKATGLLSARSDKNVDLGFVEEFNSYNPKQIFGIGDTEKLTDIKSAIQFDQDKIVQDIIAQEKTLEEIFSELNAKWKNARSN